MGEFREQRIKIDRRWWHVAIGPPPSGGDAQEVLSLLGPGGADVLLLEGSRDALEPFAERVEGETELIGRMVTIRRDLDFPEQDLPAQDLPAQCLVVGRRHRVERFALAAGVDAQVDAQVGPVGSDVVSGTYPRLPEPHEVPEFPQAQDQDPFGQSPRQIREAWLTVASFLGELLHRAHGEGVAVSLPQPPPGTRFLALDPWRHVCAIEEGERGFDLEKYALRETSYPGDEDGMQLLQRCLVTMAALDLEEEDELWLGLGSMLESLTWLLMVSELDVEKVEGLRLQVAIGSLAAGMHARQTLHGDLHTGNFAFYDGKKPVAIDADSLCTLDRPLTLEERARDLAVLKLNSSFEEWEAVKVGYTRSAPEIAPQVFVKL